MEQHSGPATLHAQILGLAAPVAVTNFPNSQNVVVTNTPLPISFKPTLLADATTFDLTMTGTPTGGPAQPKLMVPAGVVVTDVHASITSTTIPDGAFLFIEDRNHTYVNQIVNHTTFEAGLNLESGIVSDGSLNIDFVCQNSTNNRCVGALMWTGHMQ
jgi:hypothetical protein